MGLFSKKEPCAVCGGKVGVFFPWKIEGQLVCNNCHGVVDVQAGIDENMTMQQFLAYRTFREENTKLVQIFKKDYEMSLSFLGDNPAFDFSNRLFCMDRNLNKTIFHGSEINGFTILEDTALLFSGSADGLVYYESDATSRVLAMEPQIVDMALQQQMYRREEEMRRRRDEMLRREGRDVPHSTSFRPSINVPEPFNQFVVQITFDHPYWHSQELTLVAPTFNNERPDVGDYLRQYKKSYELVEELARALLAVAFPDAPSLSASEPAGATAPVAAPAAADTTVSQLRQYKELLSEGVITQEEFDAKKKQLMGL